MAESTPLTLPLTTNPNASANPNPNPNSKMTNAITQSSASMSSQSHPPTGLPYPGFSSDANIPMVSMPGAGSSSLADLPFGLDDDPDAAKRRALERETLLSHSYRRHLFFEIGTIAACMLGGLVLNILPPLKQTHNINNIAIQYPLEKQTVPEWLAAILTAFLPFVIILATKRQRGIRPAIGLLMSVGITLFITGALKNLVGELRPDFLDRCKPSPTDPAICTGIPAEIKEGRRSFPSGHSSVAAAGTVYLSLWLATRLRVFDHAHDVPKAFRLFLAHMPVCGGLAVALTRRLDHRHHWLDIIAGFVLGAYVALLTARVYIKGFELVTISVSGVTSARQLHDVDRYVRALRTGAGAGAGGAGADRGVYASGANVGGAAVHPTGNGAAAAEAHGQSAFTAVNVEGGNPGGAGYGGRL